MTLPLPSDDVRDITWGMPLHPLAHRLLQQMSRLPDLEDMTIGEARQAFAIFEGLGGVGPDVADVLDLVIPGSNHEIPVRLYVPEGEGPHPTVLWCHGGGWVLGNMTVADAYCRWLSKEANCAVLSVGYRLAPDNPFPAALEDCYAATRYLAANATTMGLDARRIAIAGESTGANLAAATAIMARDRGRISFSQQVLFFPVVDPSLSSASAQEFADGYFFTTDLFRWFWEQYTPNEKSRSHPLANLLRNDDLSSLPPAYVVLAEFDPVRDEGEQYAKKLEDAGVPVQVHSFAGMIHGFLGLEAMFESAVIAYREAAAALNKTWARQ